jgi:homocysteine S-methyltransferase
MDLATALETCPVILTECAISERLRRKEGIQLHPTLFNTPLIYEAEGRKHLHDIYFGYRKIASDAGLPVLLCAPTWRIDRKRVSESEFGPSILADAVKFIRTVDRGEIDRNKSPFFTGSLIAPKNDCYSPAEALSRDEAEEYHSWQIGEMAVIGDIDVIIAQTIPAVSEALGIADAVSATDLPYIISFVINKSGLVLDNTPLAHAIDTIDLKAKRSPLGYMVNCVHPSFLLAEEQPPGFFSRMIGIQANSSSKDHDQLDGSTFLQQDSLPEWGDQMIRLNREFGVKILGGCCGTDDSYLKYLVEGLSRRM